MKKFSKGNIVYSTNPDFNVNEDVAGEDLVTPPPNKQMLILMLDRKARAGKAVTIIKGFTGSVAELEELARFIKTKCSSGGSCKNNEILIQGDLKTKIRNILEEKGYRVKVQ